MWRRQRFRDVGSSDKLSHAVAVSQVGLSYYACTWRRQLERKPGRPATSAGGLLFTEKSTLAMGHVG